MTEKQNYTCTHNGNYFTHHIIISGTIKKSLNHLFARTKFSLKTARLWTQNLLASVTVRGTWLENTAKCHSWLKGYTQPLWSCSSGDLSTHLCPVSKRQCVQHIWTRTLVLSQSQHPSLTKWNLKYEHAIKGVFHQNNPSFNVFTVIPSTCWAEYILRRLFFLWNIAQTASTKCEWSQLRNKQTKHRHSHWTCTGTCQETKN